MFKKQSFTWCFLIVLAGVPTASAGEVSTVSGSDSGQFFFDVFLTPSPGSEFVSYELAVNPQSGTVFDPVRDLPGHAGDFDDVTDGTRLDTWANTPFSSLGAGAPSYVFTEYHPGTPPFISSDPLPTAGGTPGNLRWSVFDFNTGDTDAFGPYHIARILVSPEFTGSVSIMAFDTITVDTGGELFVFVPPLTPEPTAFVLASLGLIGTFWHRNRHRSPNVFA